LLHDQIGTGPDGAVRVSPGWATTDEHVDALLTALRSIAAPLAAR
jgi:selenocysteine lyase/cysteine desulfurase